MSALRRLGAPIAECVARDAAALGGEPREHRVAQRAVLLHVGVEEGRAARVADHAQQVARLSVSVFDQTRIRHGLDERAREWLELAALLHDAGEHISYERHHRHSYYLIKHGNLRGFEQDEIESIALIARYHRCVTPKRSHDEFTSLSREMRRTVRWLAAILRLAESLDRSRAQLVQEVILREHTDAWTLKLVARGDIELERWAAQRHTGPLEAELGHPIRLVDPRRRTDRR
jgi:exopolyphosphatase/guanosine-5'-triphosphate,3'-diphosphate pyrophosphatase